MIHQISEPTKSFTIRVPISLYELMRQRAQEEHIAHNTLITSGLAMRLSSPQENRRDPPQRIPEREASSN